MPRVSAISTLILRLRQQTAEARFRALTQLDLDRANLGTPLDGLFQPRHAEAAVGVTAAKVPGAKLPDEIPALQVIR